MSSNLRDLQQLFSKYGFDCQVVSQNRWEDDESEMLILQFPDGERRYIKPEFSINDDSWIEAGTFEQVNRDHFSDAKEPTTFLPF
jgi:hypothetical protein